MNVIKSLTLNQAGCIASVIPCLSLLSLLPLRVCCFGASSCPVSNGSPVKLDGFFYSSYVTDALQVLLVQDIRRNSLGVEISIIYSLFLWLLWRSINCFFIFFWVKVGLVWRFKRSFLCMSKEYHIQSPLMVSGLIELSN